jgi:hypothetical protein
MAVAYITSEQFAELPRPPGAFFAPPGGGCACYVDRAAGAAGVVRRRRGETSWGYTLLVRDGNGNFECRDVASGFPTPAVAAEKLRARMVFGKIASGVTAASG